MAGFTATGVGRLGQSEGFERPRLVVEGRDGPVRAALGWSACPERHARARASAQRRGSPAAGSPAEPCAAPAVAREWRQGVGRGAGARTLSVSSAPSPRA